MNFKFSQFFERLQMLYNQKNSNECGRVAQLGEHRVCNARVRGSNPLTSTNF